MRLESSIFLCLDTRMGQILTFLHLHTASANNAVPVHGEHMEYRTFQDAVWGMGDYIPSQILHSCLNSNSKGYHYDLWLDAKTLQASASKLISRHI